MALRGLQRRGCQPDDAKRRPNLNYYHPIMYEYSNATALFP